MSSFAAQVIRDHVELADALTALKDFRGLSNEFLEHLTGLARGHVGKMLGPSRQKSIGKATLKYLLLALGGRLVLELDPEQEKLMASRWEGRNEKQIRAYAHVVSKAILQRAAPVIFRQLTRNATLARLSKIPPEKRSRIAQRAAKARWKRSKHHGQIADGNAARPRGTAKTDDTAERAAKRNCTARPGAVAARRAARRPRDRSVAAANHHQ